MAGENGFLNVSVSISGLEIIPQLTTFGVAISDLSPAFEQIGHDLQDDFMANFVQQGGLFGMTSRSYLGADAGPWKPLAASTIQERIRLGFGPEPILWRTGALMESLTDRDADGAIFDVGPDHLTVGSDLFYAGFHQEGTSKMPARPMVGLSWTRGQAIKNRLRAFVYEQVRAAGLSMSGGSGEE